MAVAVTWAMMAAEPWPCSEIEDCTVTAPEASSFTLAPSCEEIFAPPTP